MATSSAESREVVSQGTPATQPPISGLDALLSDEQALGELKRRPFALLAHQASVTSNSELAHLALVRAGAKPSALFGPEHGFYGVEQDMVASASTTDPLTGIPVLSLYGDDEASLVPAPASFTGVDVLVVDLQDIGSRYYTYAATAVWAADAAIEAGCEVWILDRPNPLGPTIEGPLVQDGFSSFVGAFRLPVRHGLTLGELVGLEAHRRQWSAPVTVIEAPTDDGTGVDGAAAGYRSRWIAPSPNMPSLETARVYPGLCLLEGTTLSEGRGTTRPFELIGAPYVCPDQLLARLGEWPLPGIKMVPTFFRPQFQKHAGALCGGLQLIVSDPATFQPFLFGVRLIQELHRLYAPDFGWRTDAYEFVEDRPAIDLLTGSNRFRQAIESGSDQAVEDWIATWPEEVAEFQSERRAAALGTGLAGR